MNFLGHCLFSEATPAALAGSLWPDFGRRPDPAVASITFNAHFDRHQQIDKITDSIAVLEPMRRALRPTFRKTTPVVLDMMIDHHIALNWSDYHASSLEDFSEQTYQLLNNFDEFPLTERLEKTLFWMSEHNWFVAYRSEEGIARAMEGMSRRIRFENPMVKYRFQAIEQTPKFASQMDEFIHQLSEQLTTP